MAKTRTVICQICESPFETEVRMIVRKGKQWETTQLKGRTCPGCKQRIMKATQKEWNNTFRIGSTFRVGSHTASPKKLDHIAKSLGISLTNVRQIERRALAKIRDNNPELEELFRRWLEEGGQMPAVEPPQPEAGDISGSLVDYLLEMSSWYQIKDDLLSHGRREEALQCHREIERFHRTLKKQLQKMALASD